jgi:hypothetical protein
VAALEGGWAIPAPIVPALITPTITRSIQIGERLEPAGGSLGV